MQVFVRVLGHVHGGQPTVILRVSAQPPGGTRTKMLFADVVHRKGLLHEDGTEEIIKGLKKLVCSERRF